MPSLNVKQEKISHLGYSLPPANSHEIDLFSLIEVLWQAKRRILCYRFRSFACVGTSVLSAAAKWTNRGDCHTGEESVQWRGAGER